MKKNLIYLAAASLLFLMSGKPSEAQTSPVITNRYAMKLVENPDGTYSLLQQKKYDRFIDLTGLDGLLVPYQHQNRKLSSKDYKDVETVEYVYRKHDGYELKLAIDKAMTDAPAPFIIYCHGGGWARGTFESNKTLSKYLAQQKGITGVRIQYTLAPQPGADIEVSIQDVMDAVQFIKDHAKELNIDTERIGFVGSSAGAHLAAVGAMKCEEAKVFVGYSGIYDLSSANITMKSKDEQRIAYFKGRETDVLKRCSPYYLMPKKRAIAAQLFCGTADATVEWSQSRDFAGKLKSNRKNKVDLQVYEFYDHSLNNKASDKMEEIFFKSVDFITENL